MHRLSLVDVLQKLDCDALDGFVSKLQNDKSIKSLRLVSRSMLHVVDNSVTAVRLTVRSTDRALVSGGAPHPLFRWLRCSSIVLALDIADRNNRRNNPDAASILLLPFLGLSLEARQLIISVSAPIWDVSRWSFAGALLFHRLPALQIVSLRGEMTADNVEQQLLTDALGSLPHLRELTLWCGPALDKVDLAAAGLQRLTVLGSGVPLDARKESAISRLRQLGHLTVGLSDDNGSEQLHRLLSVLPPSVTALELPQCPVVNGFNLELQLDGGCVRTITLDCADESCEVGLDDLNKLAAGLALLPNGAVRSQVERISLSRLALAQDEANELVEGPKLQQLRSLLQRSTTLEVRCLMVLPEMSVQSFLRAFPLLGRGVQNLELTLSEYWEFNVCLELYGLDRRTELWLPGSDGAASQLTQHPPVTAGGASLMGLALERLACAPRADTGLTPAGIQASDSAAAAAAGDSSGAGQLLAGPDGGSPAQNAQTRAARSVPPVPLSMLQGPLVAALGHSEGDEDALGQWMQRLVKLAAEAAALSGGAGTAAAAGEQPMLHYVHLPTADAVMVRCSTAEGLAAAAAVARAVAESAAASGCGGGAVSSCRTTRLHVTTACVEEPNANPSHTTDEYNMRKLQMVVVLMHFLNQVIQSVLDGEEGLSAGWSERQRLGWIVEQWSRLCRLPFPEDL